MIRAEFKKLFTVRSTYILTALMVLIIFLIAFYAVGFKHPEELLLPSYLQSVAFGAEQFVKLVVAIIAILLLAHEYRYNTINYSLILSNSRSRVLFAKFVVMSVYAIVTGVVMSLLTLAFVHLGAGAAGNPIAPQDYSSWQLLGQSAFACWGMAMAGLIVVGLFRNLVGAIAFVFIFPSLEQLSGLLLKSNVGYLPFTALSAVTPVVRADTSSSFSVTKSVIIFAVYFVVFSLIAWQLFLRRDAS